MIPLQEINFHLSSDEVIFSHLVQLHDGTFTAQVSPPHKYSEIPEIKYLSWLPCPTDASATAAFVEMVSYCSKQGNKNLVKVNNPCNCEFLPAAQQQTILGSGVAVTVNEPT